MWSFLSRESFPSYFFSMSDVSRDGGALSVVEERTLLLRNLVVPSRLDAPQDLLEVGEIGVERRVPLEKGLLGRVARAHVLHHAGRVRANAGGQVVEEPLCRRQVPQVGDLGDHSEELEARVARAHLLERPHARRLPREELLDLAAQVNVEADRSDGRGHRQAQRDHPEGEPMAERPGDVGAHRARGAAG